MEYKLGQKVKLDNGIVVQVQQGHCKDCHFYLHYPSACYKMGSCSGTTRTDGNYICFKLVKK